MGHSCRRGPCISIYRKRVHAANRRRTTGPFRNCWTFAGYLEWRIVGETLWARKRQNPQKKKSFCFVRLAAARSLSFVYRCVTLSAAWSRYHCYLTPRRNWIVFLFIGPDARDKRILLPLVIFKQKKKHYWGSGNCAKNQLSFFPRFQCFDF
jgi:hypothetical protein